MVYVCHQYALDTSDRKVGTDFDHAVSGYVIVEITRVEVAQDRAYRQDKFCRLNLLLDLRTTQGGSPVDLGWRSVLNKSQLA